MVVCSQNWYLCDSNEYCTAGKEGLVAHRRPYVQRIHHRVQREHTRIEEHAQPRVVEWIDEHVEGALPQRRRVVVVLAGVVLRVCSPAERRRAGRKTEREEGAVYVRIVCMHGIMHISLCSFTLTHSNFLFFFFFSTYWPVRWNQ